MATVQVALCVKGVPVPHAGAATVTTSLVICGEGPELGDWDPEKSPALAAADTEGVYRGTVTARLGANFKCVLLARKRNPQWEGNRPNRIVHVLEAGAEPDEHVWDELDAHERELLAEAEAPKLPPAKVTLTVQGVPTLEGGKGTVAVALCGEGPTLGQWDPAKGPRLQPAPGMPGTFSGEITSEDFAFFKYVALGANHQMRWEQGRPDRAFPDTNAGALEFQHHFDKIEAFEDQSVYLPPDERRKRRHGNVSAVADAAAEVYGGFSPKHRAGPVQWESVEPEVNPADVKETALLWRPAPGAKSERLAIFHAFHWQFRDLRSKLLEIKQMGFDAVQISPAQKSKAGNEWWTRYQPQDYLTIEGLGSEAELAELCRDANNAGLMVIADVVFNHMLVVAGCDEWKKAQKTETLEEKLWKRLEDACGPTFTRDDFAPWHPMLGDNWDNEHRFEGWGSGEWSELKYSPKVVSVQQQHIEKLLEAGVRGIRFDAAKHMRPAHLKEHVDWLRARLPDVYMYLEVLSIDPKMHAEYDCCGAPTTDFELARSLRELWRTGVLPLPQDGSPATATPAGVPVLPGDSVRFTRNHDTVANPGAPVHGLDWNRSEAALANAALLAAHDGTVLLLAEDAWGSGAVRAALLFRAELKRRFGALHRTEMCAQWRAGHKPGRAPPARVFVAVFSDSGACVGVAVLNLTRKVVALGRVPQLQVQGGASSRPLRALAGLAEDPDPAAVAARCEVCPAPHEEMERLRHAVGSADGGIVVFDRQEQQILNAPEELRRLWDIVGGAEKGGIMVREGRDLNSAQAPSRLSHGAVVEQLELVGERLRYKLVRGTGPEKGWISISLAGKALAVSKAQNSGSMGGGSPQAGSAKGAVCMQLRPQMSDPNSGDSLRAGPNGELLFPKDSKEQAARLVLAPRSAVFLLPEAC